MVRLIVFIGIVFLGVILLVALSSRGSKSPISSSVTPTQDTNALNAPPVSVTPSPSAAVTQTVTPSVPASVSATITTSKGDIVLTLFGSEAPRTVANFISKANSGYYKNLTFHRVEDWVIQGGDPKGNGTGGGDMPTELNSKPFIVGSLGVARANDITISNDSQFFITKKDSSFLNQQYTNFGVVTKGMDVVNQIQVGDKIMGITIQ